MATGDDSKGNIQQEDKVIQVACTPTQLAIMQGDSVCARMLLERGGLLATPDYTAAHLAAMMGHLDVVKIVIDRLAMDMTAQDKVRQSHDDGNSTSLSQSSQYGYTTHHWAAIKGHRKIVDLLLSREARLKKRYNDSRRDAEQATTSAAILTEPVSPRRSNGQIISVVHTDGGLSPVPSAEQPHLRHVRRPSEIEPIHDDSPSLLVAQEADDEEDMLTDPASSDEESEYPAIGRRRSSRVPASLPSSGKPSIVTRYDEYQGFPFTKVSFAITGKHLWMKIMVGDHGCPCWTLVVLLPYIMRLCGAGNALSN